MNSVKWLLQKDDDLKIVFTKNVIIILFHHFKTDI